MPNLFVLAESRGLSVYPNPVVDQFTIEIDQELVGEGQFRIYGLGGELLSEETVSAQSMTRSLEQFAPGIYIIEVKGLTQVLRTKVIKL